MVDRMEKEVPNLCYLTLSGVNHLLVFSIPNSVSKVAYA